VGRGSVVKMAVSFCVWSGSVVKMTVSFCVGSGFDVKMAVSFCVGSDLLWKWPYRSVWCMHLS